MEDNLQEVVVFDANGEVYESKVSSRLPWFSIVIIAASAALWIAILVGHVKKSWKSSPPSRPSDESGITLPAGGSFQLGTVTTTYPDGWVHKPRLKPPVDAPPRKVLVGKSVYTIHYTSSDALELIGGLAMTDPDKKEIWLDPERVSEIRDDLMHELMHCAALERDPNNWQSAQWGGGEESAVKHISPGLIPMFRKNPALLHWLLNGKDSE